MSAKGKNFGVNVSATLDEAKAAGDNGILYIPESEQEGVMVFGGKEFASIPKAAKGYLVDQLNTVGLADFKPTLTSSISHRTYGSLSNMPTTYFERNIKCSFTDSDANKVTNGYQKITIIFKASYKDLQGSAMNKEVIGGVSIIIPSIASNVTLKKLDGNEVNGTLHDITASVTTTYDLIKQTDNSYTLDLYVADNAFNISSTNLFTVKLYNTNIDIYNDYDIKLTKSCTTTIVATCKSSSWIIESNLSQEEIESKLTNNQIYYAPFLINTGTNGTIRNSSISGSTVTLSSGYKAYILISDETTFNSFMDSSGQISYTASDFYKKDVNIKFADGETKVYKLYIVDGAYLDSFKNIK